VGPRPVSTTAEILVPTGIRSPDRPARRQSNEREENIVEQHN